MRLLDRFAYVVRHIMCMVGATGALALLAACGGSGGSSTSSGVALTGTVSVPSTSTSDISMQASKSVGPIEASTAASLATDAAAGSGNSVKIYDAKTGDLLGSGKTNSTGAYSISIPTTATDVYVEAVVNGATLSTHYTAAGVAASGVDVNADDAAAMLTLMQSCKDATGEDISSIADLAQKCAAKVSDGSIIPAAIIGPILTNIQDGVSDGSVDASSGKGVGAAVGLAMREMILNKLKGTLKIDPFEIFRKAQLSSDADSLSSISTYAPLAAGSASPSDFVGFYRDKMEKSVAAVANDSTTYASFKANPSTMGKFFENLDSSSAANFIANPGVMRGMVQDAYTNSETDKLKDAKDFQLYSQFAGDSSTLAKLGASGLAAAAQLLYNSSVSGLSAADAAKVGAGLVALMANTCPSGTCNSTKLTSLQACPSCYAGPVVAAPAVYAGSGGATAISGLIQQFGSLTAATKPATPPTLIACDADDPCAAGSACFGGFCQATTATSGQPGANLLGASCTFPYECQSFNCSNGFCQSNGSATLLAKGATCTNTAQCAPPLTCDPSTSTCSTVQTLNGLALGGKYQKASGAGGTVLNSSFTITVTNATSFVIGFTDNLIGTLSNGVISGSKLSFSGTVKDTNGADVSINCSNIDVSNGGSTLSGSGVCTVGGTSKDVNHTKSS